MSQPLNPQPQSGPPAPHLKDGWGGLRRIGDWRQWLGTNGAVSGTSGRQFWTAWGAFAGVGVGVNILDVITILHDRPELRPIVPIIGEITSLVMLLSLLWLPWLAWRQPGPLRPRTLLGHAAALITFSAAHVTGFTVLRKIIYWTVGWHYGGDFPGDYIYEFPRDAIAYGLAMLAFSMAGQRLEARAAPSGGRALFDIRDGTRLLRVPFDDILAVSSAGNYVEFVLRDGRKPLMRSPLSA
ncbi:MAG TPA: hypothetical protein VGV37_11015, partial [Aliidongia sp.]|uniref:hypothetical protein n=1 Tax=Aliidongia sp. TaxID=1914230 RepID=UPI002DDD62FB